jgi:NADH-quinone oxidoreductase subunit E
LTELRGEAGEEVMDLAAERGHGSTAMSDESMSIFSPRLAARFDALVEKYPLRRSALVPMLLYAQDEIGYLSDTVIAEVAGRIGITEMEVRNVASYYSMLRFKPAGKYHVQVCTNISCMLRGGYEVYERFQDELGVGAKGVTADGLFSIEEVECIGACCWAPAIQVNYEFHDELKPAQVPDILAAYRGKAGVPSDGSLSLGWKSKAEAKALDA